MIALTDITSESRTSTRAQYVKLNDRYEVKNVTIRIAHLSRTKMIKQLVVHYTPRTLTTQTLKNW